MRIAKKFCTSDPADKQVTIRINGNRTIQYSFREFNSTHKLVEGRGFTGITLIDISGYSSGLNFIHPENHAGQIKKFIRF